MSTSGNPSTSEPHRFSMFVPTLKMLAVQQMTLVLYKNEIHPSTDYWLIDPKDIVVGLPSVLSEIIKKCLEYFTSLWIPHWCDYHSAHVFFDGPLSEAIANCIEEIVLKPDGQISFRSTAKNIITGNKLNLVEKYRLACLYCLEDDIRHIWPMVKDDLRVTESTNPVIHYWNCVMKGEAPRFPGTDPNSLEECLVILKPLRWDSIEYFWNILSADEQVTAAKQLLITNAVLNINCVEHLLLRLDETQLRRIMREIPLVEVLFERYLTYFYVPECPKILYIWIYIKHFISPLEFLKIIEIFINCFTFESEFSDLLFEVWTSASDEHRDVILNNFGNSVKNIFQWLKPRFYDRGEIPPYSDMRFFVDVLKSTRLDFQFKKNLWFDSWPKLIMYTSPEYLDMMMKACFQNENEITQFKESHMMNFYEIRVFCEYCFELGYISKLDNFLNYSSSDINRVRRMKQQIIRSEDFLRAFWVNSLLNQFQRCVDELSKFIDSASFCEEEAEKHKKNYSNPKW